MRLLFVIALAMILLAFPHCKHENMQGQPDVPVQITANIHGNVVDENGWPAENVTITTGSRTVLTDAEGFFYLPNAVLNSKAALVTAEKQGYFKGYRIFSANSGTNQVIIKLRKKTLAGTVDAGSGGKITLPNGAAVTLSANGVVKEQGMSAYAGNVQVYATYIDPLAADIGEVVPGSFLAEDKDGASVHLLSYGMMVVELESPSGEKLQVKPGSTAELRFPVPAALAATAPATIPLWYVKDQTGIWKEEGSAVKQGNEYVGNVSHFTPYNVDVPAPSIMLSFQLKSNGRNLSYFKVNLKNGPSLVNAITTNHAGVGTGSIPMNQPLTLEIVDQCQAVVYTQNIMGSGQNINLGPLEVSLPGLTAVTLQGKLTDCSGNPVTGHAVISLNGINRTIETGSNGNFSTEYVVCAGSQQIAYVRGVNPSAQQLSSYIPVNLAGPVSNAGNVEVCGSALSSSFMKYVFNGSTYVMNSEITDTLRGYLSGTYGQVHCYNVNTGDNIMLNFNHQQKTGTYPLSGLAVQNLNTGQVTLGQPAWISITKYATAPGEFYEGTFYARFTAGGQQQVGGSFRIRRN